MRRRVLMIAVLLLCMVGTLVAQDRQDWTGWQFYAGGNWLTTNVNPELPPLAVSGHVGGYGWEAAVTQYVPSHAWFGAVVDLSGSYGRHGTLIIPANSLGAANPPDTVVVADGGGFDWMITKRFGARAQVDYIEANFKDPYSDLQHEVRASLGIVMHL